MRISILAIGLLGGALVLAPRQSSAQISVNIHLGTPLTVTSYTPAVHGDWHRNYTKWRPTTVYEYQGKYYPHSVHGARAVAVYHSQNQYFLPPQDPAWKDRRYNARHRPTPDDYNHVTPAEPPHRRP